MAGMLFFCKRALCYELSVLNPFPGVGNKRGHCTTVLASTEVPLPSQECKTDAIHI